MSVPPISSSASTESTRPVPWCDLQKQAVEFQLLSPGSGETRTIRVLYDPTITSFFEIYVCNTCGAKSSDQDPYQPLIHKNCLGEEIVVTIGDNIGVQRSACFRGLPGNELNFIFDAAHLKHQECIAFIYSHLLPQLHKVLGHNTFN